MKRFFTSESVTEGHPDKLCDQISDTILDAILSKDTNAHIVCDVTITKGWVRIMREIYTKCYVVITTVEKNLSLDFRYNNSEFDFDGGIISSINSQSPDISLGVNHQSL